jgi:glycosyltransferase involved in cell wall biosynthesis
VVLEALACGRPVLATEAGGTGELLEGLEGMLTTTRDPGSLAERLGTLLDAGWAPEHLREHARSFSWEAGLDSLERCLQGALP